MVAVLEDRLDAIRTACQRFDVARLYVFGSVLRDDFEPGQSDIDLLVDFGPMSPYGKPNAYFGLLDELRAVLVNEIDSVMVGAPKNRCIDRRSIVRSSFCMQRESLGGRARVHHHWRDDEYPG